jgi:hypothetical protein
MLAKHHAIMNDHESPRILVADVASGTLRPAAHQDCLVLSSGHAPWRDSLLVEQYRRPPFEGSAHYSPAHLISMRRGPPTLLDWWISGERPRRQLVTPGDVHLTSAGVPIRNGSQDPFETLVLALAPSFVQHAAHEFTGTDPLELRNQRAIRDAQFLYLGLALQVEIAAGARVSGCMTRRWRPPSRSTCCSTMRSIHRSCGPITVGCRKPACGTY